MSKGTPIKEAIAKWEDKNGMKATESPVVKLCGLNPPIEKMDGTLGQLVHCEKLSLSTNNIDKIAHLTNLRSLKILSLGRNNIKSFAGLEAVGDVLEELWISYNNIEKTKGIGALKKCKVLYMSNNLVKDPKEFEKLNEMPSLEQLVFVGNPLEESLTAEEKWRDFASSKLPRLKKLDGVVVLR